MEPVFVFFFAHATRGNRANTEERSTYQCVWLCSVLDNESSVGFERQYIQANSSEEIK